MKLWHWGASIALLVVLIAGVGCIMFYVAADGTLLALVVGASLTVLAWHGLRRLGPVSEDGERPEESPAFAVLATLVVAALMLPILWSPWFGVLSLIAVVGLRLLTRSED
jgi:hypothetical protein